MTDPADHTAASQRASSILTINLDAITQNWQFFRDTASPAEAGAVVKADAYGLGVGEVAPALFNAGCKTFFVATLDEGIALRGILGKIPAIHVFGGLLPNTEREFQEHDLIPVLNSLDQVAAWRAFGALPCDLHIDTGMSRLGLDSDEQSQIRSDLSLLSGLNIDLCMSHLTESEITVSAQSEQQLADFKSILPIIGAKRASLANSSGVLRGVDYHFDVVRPGVALFGVNPTPDLPNPVAQVIRLQAKILQVRTIDSPVGVGYGSTYQAPRGARIATLGVGYADGYSRHLSNVAQVYFGEYKAPLVGRISMDLCTVDVTHIPNDQCLPGMLADLIGPHNPVDAVADWADTIGYEILTQLSHRSHRKYLRSNC